MYELAYDAYDVLLIVNEHLTSSTTDFQVLKLFKEHNFTLMLLGIVWCCLEVGRIVKLFHIWEWHLAIFVCFVTAPVHAALENNGYVKFGVSKVGFSILFINSRSESYISKYSIRIQIRVAEIGSSWERIWRLKTKLYALHMNQHFFYLKLLKDIPKLIRKNWASKICVHTNMRLVD